MAKHRKDEAEATTIKDKVLATNCKIITLPKGWSAQSDVNVVGKYVFVAPKFIDINNFFKTPTKAKIVKMGVFHLTSFDGQNDLVLIGVAEVEGNFVDVELN